jgi:long-chain acyl-CoA synthetase
VGDDVRNLAETVRRAGLTSPDSPAFVVSDPAGDVVTWREFDARVDGVAAALAALDLPCAGPTGPRVAIALPNVPEFAAALFGTLRAGLVAVPLNPGYTARELRQQLGDSGTSVIVGTADVLETLAEVRAELPALRHAYTVGAGAVDGARPFADLARDTGPVESTVGGEDLAVLLYTSGTAGVPKGAMLSHRALIANHHQVGQVTPPIVSPSDVVLLALPMFHIFGLNAGLGAVAWHAACGVLVERFDPVESLSIIAQRRISVMFAVPQMYAAWSTRPELGESLESVRIAVSGAAPLDPMVARRFHEASRHHVVQGYGLTETSPVVTTALASPVSKTGSIGRPIPDVEIRLVAGDGSEIARVTQAGVVNKDHEAEFGEDVNDFDDGAGPDSDPGQIVVRGPNLFSGYWPRGDGGPDQDGWWATGDVAYVDGDGDLFLVDRLGELILVSGFNVYPHEVELVLAGHPGVVEAAVVGVASPQTGQAVKAYVVLSGPGAASVQDLMTHCQRNLARFKCPTSYEFVSELPHSAIGKVRKGSIRGLS